MRVKDYSVAVYELLKTGSAHDDVLTHLKRLLVARRHERLYPKILRELTGLLTKKEQENSITVTLAHTKDKEQFHTHINEAVTILNGSTYETRIDPHIIGGFIAEGNTKRIDASYKTKLLTLYRSLIA